MNNASNEALIYVGDLTPREIDIECYQNIHKDIYGVKCRGIDWNLVSDEELTEMLNQLVRIHEEEKKRIEEYRAEQKRKAQERVKRNRKIKKMCHPTLAAIWPK